MHTFSFSFSHHINTLLNFSLVIECQVLLNLPAAFLDFPFIKEMVTLHSSIDTKDKAFALWAAMSPGDKDMWYAFELDEKVDEVLGVKAKGDGHSAKQSDGAGTYL